MTSAAEKYGKIPESLSEDARKQVLSAGQALQQNQVKHEGTVSHVERPAPTPAKHANDNESPQRGLSR